MQKPDADERQISAEQSGKAQGKGEGSFLVQTKASRGLLERSPQRISPAPAPFEAEKSAKELVLNVESGKAWGYDADSRVMENTPDDALAEFAAGVTKFSVRSSLIEGGMGMKGGTPTEIPQEGGPDEQRSRAGGEG